MSTIRTNAILDAAGGNTATINGKLPIALSDVPAPTTTEVLTATAGASVGTVGTYAFLRRTTSTVTNPGATLAGSALQYSNGAGSGTSSNPSGTWMLMGYLDGGGSATASSVFLRIA